MIKMREKTYTVTCSKCRSTRQVSYTQMRRVRTGISKCGSCGRAGGNGGTFNRGDKPWNAGKTGVQKGHWAGKKRPNIAGPNNYNWQGGITPNDKDERNRFNRQMRPLVLTRDNYTCQVCLEVGARLHVDHIEGWRQAPHLRFELDNCRAVCIPCHYYLTFKRKMPKRSTWGLMSLRKETR